MRTLVPVQTLYSSFKDASLADRAVGALLDFGVTTKDVSLVAKAAVEDELIDPHKEYDEASFPARQGITATTPADAAVGAAKGAGIGLGVGALAAISSILIPGVGLVIGGGALATAIAGAAGTTAAGAVAGGVHGYLKDQGIPEEAISSYSGDFQNGGAILGVSIPSNGIDEETVKRILSKYQGNYICTFGDYEEA